MITSTASKRLSAKLRRETEQEIAEIRALLTYAKSQLMLAQAMLRLAQSK